MVFLIYPMGKCWQQKLKVSLGWWARLSRLPCAFAKPEVPRRAFFPRPRELLEFGFLAFSILWQSLFPWLTEEVPAQQYLEIDEVTTDSFRVTWHPLSADEGQHKLMWIPVYGGNTEEVSCLKQTEKSSGAFSLEVNTHCTFELVFTLKEIENPRSN